MKKALCLLGVLPLLAQELPDSITLDPSAIDEVMGQMKAEKTAAGEGDAWRAAMNAPTPEEQTVLLLALLQAQNPDKSMQTNPELYAEALRLHRRALAGEQEAVAALAAALRSGVLPGGLHLPVNAAAAATLENRPRF